MRGPGPCPVEAPTPGCRSGPSTRGRRAEGPTEPPTPSEAENTAPRRKVREPEEERETPRPLQLLPLASDGRGPGRAAQSARAAALGRWRGRPPVPRPRSARASWRVGAGRLLHPRLFVALALFGGQPQVVDCPWHGPSWLESVPGMLDSGMHVRDGSAWASPWEPSHDVGRPLLSAVHPSVAVMRFLMSSTLICYSRQPRRAEGRRQRVKSSVCEERQLWASFRTHHQVVRHRCRERFREARTRMRTPVRAAPESVRPHGWQSLRGRALAELR